ncbi:phr [Symbiodinium necroappetens]|uniref:Phr protein n=1 Tax=Symbiodinium necroappetens TaxID=1628268 RepID=A0A812JYM8_9DINO|nr:phr [Symbiodinium necroappetens]
MPAPSPWTLGRRSLNFALCFTLSVATTANSHLFERYELAVLDLGVRLPNGSMHTLISAVNCTRPAPLRRREVVLEVGCDDMGELQLPLFTRIGARIFVLHKIRLPCPQGSTRLEQGIEFGNDGLWFSVAQATQAGGNGGNGSVCAFDGTLPLREHVMSQGELLAVSVSLSDAVTHATETADSQVQLISTLLRTLRALPSRCDRDSTSMTDLVACRKHQKLLEDYVAEAKLASEQWRSTAGRREKEFELLSQRTKELQRKLKTLKGKSVRDQGKDRQALETMLQMKSAELEHRRREALWWSIASAVVAGSSALGFFTWKHYGSGGDDLSLDAKKERRKLLRLLGRVKAKSEMPSEKIEDAETAPAAAAAAETSEATEALNSSAGDPADQLFPHSVELERRRNRDVQCVRIQCPGVQEADVTIKVVFNGAEVHIDRQECAGLPAVSWKHRFIFPSEEGHVVFADDETKLSHGLSQQTLLCFAVPWLQAFKEHPTQLIFGRPGLGGDLNQGKRSTMSANVASSVPVVEGVDVRRCRRLNSVQLKESTGPVIYWMSRDQRSVDNWALIYAQKLAIRQSAPLHVVFSLVPKFLDATLRQYDFLLKGLREVAVDLESKNMPATFPFHLQLGKAGDKVPALVNELSAQMVVCDMSPLRVPSQWARDVADACQAKEGGQAMAGQIAKGREPPRSPLAGDAVAISFRLRGLTFEAISKPTMKALKKALRGALAEASGHGIGMEHVAVSLGEEPLVVDANIWPPPSVSCEAVEEKLRSCMTSLPDSIQSWIAEIPLPDLAGSVKVSKSSLTMSIIRSDDDEVREDAEQPLEGEGASGREGLGKDLGFGFQLREVLLQEKQKVLKHCKILQDCLEEAEGDAAALRAELESTKGCLACSNLTVVLPGGPHKGQ